MGDWMRVKIEGTCGREHVSALRKNVEIDIRGDTDWDAVTCLSSSGGICGLPNWANENIEATGNCFERNYTPESVVEALGQYAKIAPSLAVKVHCGGENESDKCVATISLKDGVVNLGGPEIASIPELDQQQMQDNFMRQMQASAMRRAAMV